MKINRPIIWFDLETTGTQIDHDRIVQIAITKIFPDGHNEQKNHLINPTIPIPTGASDVHGITDDMVADKPTFKQLASAMFDYFFGCDLAGFNSDRFDIPLLIMEFQRCGIEFPTWDPLTLDGHKIESALNPRTLSALFKKYTGNELDDAHDAENDVAGTITVANKQMDAIRARFPELLDESGVFTPEILEVFGNRGKKRFDYSGKCYVDDNGIVCWNFGKNRGKSVLSDINYLNWVMNANFPKELITKLSAYKKEQSETANVRFLGMTQRISKSMINKKDVLELNWNDEMVVKYFWNIDGFVAINAKNRQGDDITTEIKGKKLIIE